MPTLTLRPNDYGDKTGCDQFPDTGAKWEKVDDVTPDDDATYLYVLASPSAGKIELCELQNHTTESGPISSVTVYGRFRRDPAYGYLGASLVIKTNGKMYGFWPFSPSTWTTFSKEITTNPKTSAAWTWDEIDALQIGCTLGSAKEIGEDGYCTQLYAVVSYELEQIVYPDAIDSAEAFGTLKVNQTIKPTGIASAEAFGTTNVARDQFLLPDAIASAEAIGTVRINRLDLILLYKTFTEGQVDGIRVKFPNTGGVEKWARVHELDFLITDPPIFVLPSAIASAEAIGTPTIQLYILPIAIVSAEAIGTPIVGIILIFSGIASAEAFGTAWLINSSLSVVVGRELLPERLKVRRRLLPVVRLLP